MTASGPHQRDAVKARRAGRAGARLGKAGTYGCMGALALFYLVPILFMVVGSLKPQKVIFDDMATVIGAFLPTQVTLNNYAAVFRLAPLDQYLRNSLMIVFVALPLSLAVNSLAAYALARLEWPGRRLVLILVIALMIVPFEAIVIPLITVVNVLPWIDGSTSWLDSLHVQILPFVADAFAIFLFYQYFIGIPREFDEAAQVDGAGPFTIFRAVIVPMSQPIFATVAIFVSLAYWSAYLWPLLVVQSDEFRPLPVAIGKFFQRNDWEWGQVLAFATISTLPFLILFLIFQRRFLESAASAGLKG